MEQTILPNFYFMVKGKPQTKPQSGHSGSLASALAYAFRPESDILGIGRMILVGIFGIFPGILPFPHYHFTNTLYFLAPPSHFHFIRFISG